MGPERPSELKERTEKAGRFTLRVTSYRLGAKFLAKVDNVSPGAVVSRAEAPSRAEAEENALREAREAVRRNRVIE